MPHNDPTHPRASDPNFQYNRWLSSPPPGEEVVITGISAKLPESDNVRQFRENLFNKVEMVSGDYRRWKLEHPEVPQRIAKINTIDRYDAGFFGVHHRQAEIMDPMMRIIMETAIEAIMDAGVNPKELEGSKTGVFVSTSWSDMEVNTCVNVNEPQRFAMTGYLRSLISHRISYHLRLKSPACNIDTACSSSLNAFDTAFKAIRSGKCDSAIVGGTNLLLHPGISLQFFRLGVLSPKGICRPFDQKADGYVRGETIGCVFLQRAKDSRRIYAQIINTKVNGDGFKEQGITFPSTQAQINLMSEIYDESNIRPCEISFLEAHGTGTEVGDPQEVEAIDRALAKPSNKEFLVGSVKCSIGHTEPASGICSLIKVIIAMETGLIPPNINLTKLKSGLGGFDQGRMKVITETTRLDQDDAIIGINNFGFGGNNAHTILRRFKKRKINGGTPEDDIPRLVCVSGRTQKSVSAMLKNITLDAEYIGLLHQMYKTNIDNHVHRGYTIVSKSGSIKTSSKFLAPLQTPLYIVYGDFQKTSKTMGLYLLQFPVFKDICSRMNPILKSKNSKPVEQLLSSTDEMLGAICVQIGIVEILRLLQIYPSAVYGEDRGKIAAAYHYESVSFEEAVSMAVKLSHLESEPNQDFESKVKYSNHDLKTLPKNSFIFTISDSHWCDKDILPVKDNTVIFLEILGRLYEEGHNPQLHHLYPKIEFPVSRNTPMVSPLIQWEHRKSWYAFKFSEFTTADAEQREYSISYMYDEYKYIAGHVIDGRNLFPATEYLHLAWRTFAQSRRLLVTDLPVIFEHCKFLRAVTMPKRDFVALLVTIQRGTGYFEVLEKNSVVASGTIRVCNNPNLQQNDLGDVVFDDNPKSCLEQDEIYRELYLRGYNYSGAFKGLKKCNIEASAGLIEWENNWSSFMDKMLQLLILQADTRLLFVPVGIRRVVIDPMKQLQIADNVNSIPVFAYKECNIVKSGGIEICGLQAKSIARKSPPLDPILERHEFVPFAATLDASVAIRVNTQIILENSLETHFKAVEVVDDYTKPDDGFLLHLVCKALDDVPVVTPDLTISSKTFIEDTPGIKVDNITLTPDSNMLLVIGTKFFQRMKTLKQILSSLNKNGFILTREDLNFVPAATTDAEIVTEYTTPNEKLVLLKKNEVVSNTFVEVSSTNSSWLLQTKTALKQNSNVVVWARNQEPEGVLGFVNCVRREPGGNKLKCVFIMGEAPNFNPQNGFYGKQIAKNLANNIYKNNRWGTYRHLPLEDFPESQCQHCYVGTTIRGNISSLRWLEGELSDQATIPEGRFIVETYYSAVNFKDIMTASGRVNVEALSTDRREQECLLGFEFSGRDNRGRRVIGMTTNKALASRVLAHEDFIWEVPEHWSLEDGATTPVVYSTAMYSVLLMGNLKSGDSILIHSATGGIGLAALNVCLYHDYDVYVTVGTEEKREYLRRHYPQIPESHIGNSRDTSFEEMIKSETGGRGVDVVLNSLTEDKLKASIRCLAHGGKFLEIGKFDLANDTTLQLLFMEREASYHGIMLDRIFKESKVTKAQIFSTVNDGIKNGSVKPLPRNVFDKDEVEAAYRYMMTGKHIGKVLVKIRDEEDERNCVPQRKYFKGQPKFNCDGRFCYIIVGGLGGIGLELADWLVLRGAKKLILVSRSGVQSGYQMQRINIWRSYGVQVTISLHDVTTRQGCVNLIRETTNLGPIDAIFNLAVVLKDALFEDQTEETFFSALSPKAQATNYLDQVTRELCSQLRYFVVFSSVSCGRGNVGQSNYGMANSIMERICEKRKQDGLPALAIQWGAIGEVGLVAKMQKENKELVIGGTLQQKISSCFQALDRFLKQDHPIVGSMVVAEKYRSDRQTSPVEAVAYVLGIKNIKTISPHTTLAELGMDSMTGTEIIQLLEKDFDIYVTAKDIRSLTFAKLKEMEVEREQKDDKTELGTKMLIQFIPDKSNDLLPIKPLESQVKDSDEATTVFVLPGIEGILQPLELLTKLLKAHVLGIQYNYSDPPDSIQEVAESIVPHIEQHLRRDSPFCVIGYSFGGAVALEIAKILEDKGHKFKIILIDASPTYLQAAARDYLPEETEAEFQTSLIYKLLNVLLPIDALPQHKEGFLKCATFEDRLDLGLALIPSVVPDKQKLEKQAAVTLYKRFKAVIDYRVSDGQLGSEVHLFKARYSMVDVGEDYQMSKLCQKPVHVETIDGDHVTILERTQLAQSINEIIACKANECQ